MGGLAWGLRDTIDRMQGQDGSQAGGLVGAEPSLTSPTQHPGIGLLVAPDVECERRGAELAREELSASGGRGTSSSANVLSSCDRHEHRAARGDAGAVRRAGLTATTRCARCA